MIAGAFIAFFGIKLSVAAIRHTNSDESNQKNIKIVSGIAIAIILVGVWMITNAMELYYYIVHNGLMELFF
jgi:hypothetical protein